MLTDTTLNKLKVKSSPYSVNDMNGLSIYITPKGKKSWYFRYRKEGTPCKLSLGAYPALSLKEARIKRDAMHALLANGIDPRTQKTKSKSIPESKQPTFKAFIPEWKELKFKKLGFSDPNRRNSTQIQIERYLNKDILPALGDIPLDQITRQDVLGVLRKMEKRGAFTPAEKVRSWLKEIFKHALVVGYIEMNPATDMEVVALPKPPVINNPHLTMDELPEFMVALANYPGEKQIQLAIKLLLLTGVRPGELRFAKPGQFDVEEALWTIPAIEVKQLQRQIKQGKDVPDYLVPLSTQAVEVVKELLGMCYKNQKYLLLGRTASNKPICENALNLGIKRIGYAGRLTSHGIRGTLSTALYELEYDEKWIEGQLSHVNPNPVVRAYNHAKYVKQRRTMMQEWADRLDQWLGEAQRQN